MNFITCNYNKEDIVGILLEDKIIPVNEVLDFIGMNKVNSMLELIENFTEDLTSKIKDVISKNNFNYIPLNSVKLLAPVPRPRRNILCLGKNYEEHVKELGKTRISDTSIPDAPIYFTKDANSVIANEEQIKFSYAVTNQVDYEAELAVIIGKEGINIPPEKAEEYIFGYTIVNDISARDCPWCFIVFKLLLLPNIN